MLGDALKSLSDYADTRIKNPFLGTLIIVWFIRNFEFIYALLYFEDGVTLTQKEDYIFRYFRAHDIWYQLHSIWIAFILFSVTFLLLLAARGLSNGYSFLLNLLNHTTDKGSVVSREDFKTLEKTVSDLRNNRDELRLEIKTYEEDISRLKENIRNEQSEKLEIENRALEHLDSIEKFGKEVHRLENLLENTDTDLSDFKIKLIDEEKRYIALKNAHEVETINYVKLQIMLANQKLKNYKYEVDIDLIKVIENFNLSYKHRSDVDKHIYERFFTDQIFIDFYLNASTIEFNNDANTVIDIRDIKPFIALKLIKRKGVVTNKNMISIERLELTILGRRIFEEIKTGDLPF